MLHVLFIGRAVCLSMYKNFVYCLAEIKPCPKCSALISKMNDGSCNHIQCTVCGADFCWLCLQEITELHYLRFVGFSYDHDLWCNVKKYTWLRTSLLVMTKRSLRWPSAIRPMYSTVCDRHFSVCGNSSCCDWADGHIYHSCLAVH